MSRSKPDSAPERLAALQTRFAAHIRDPGHAPAPGDVEDRRMAIYRELFFNNISKLLAANFPVLRRLYGDDAWARLVREFYVEHRAHTPIFPELPREFLKYLQEVRGERDGDPPFLLELAHYEWVELALQLDEHELDDIDADADGDLLANAPVLSPLAWPLSYHFPVHRIGPEHRPETAPDEATHLLAYRDRADRVRFMQLNAVSVRLLQLLQEHAGQPGQMVLETLAAEIGHPQPDSVVAHGAQLLSDWRDRDVVLGTRPAPRDSKRNGAEDS